MAIADPQLARVLSDLVNVLGGTTTSLAGFNRQIQQSASTASSAASRSASMSQAIGQQLSMLNDRYAEAGRRTGRLSDDFDQLRRATSLLEDGIDKTSKITQINALQMKASTIAFTEFFKDTFTKQLGQSLGTLITNIQTGTDPIAIANSINKSIVALASGAVKSVGDLLKNISGAVGSSLQKVLGPVGGKVAKALGGFAGGLVNATGSLLTGTANLASFTTEIFATELEKTTQAFSQITASGALFADGMTGMRNAAGAAGLTLNTFVSAVQKNSDSLTKAGLGVSGGAQKMGQALAAGGEPMRLQLLNLGFSLEEQAGLVADVMADMRQAGEAQLQPAEVAQATQKYAENLRIISAITGEDAKKRMDAARQAANQLAFQEKLAGMNEKQRQAAVGAMANMSEIQRKNFMDTVLFGSVINREGAAAAAMSSGLSDSVDQMARNFSAGTLTPETVRDINKTYGETIKEQALELGKTIGIAGAAGVGGIVGALSEMFSKEVQERIKMSPKAIADAEANATALATTTEKLTIEATKIVSNVTAMQVQFEKLMGEKALPAYAGLTETVTGAMRTAADNLETMIRRMFGESALPPQPKETEQQREDRLTAAALEEIRKTGRDFSDMKQEDFNAMVETRKAELAAFENRSSVLMRTGKIERALGSVEMGGSGEEEEPLRRVSSSPRSGYTPTVPNVNDLESDKQSDATTTNPGDTPTNTASKSADVTPLVEVVKEQNTKFDNLLASNTEILRVLQQSRDITRDLRDNYA